MRTQPSIALIVPAYHAARTLPRTLARIPAARLPACRVLVVDDGSRDETGAVAREAGRELGLDLEVLRHERNQGYGAAQKTGFRRALEIGIEALSLIHADGQYAPEELPQVLAPLLAGRADLTLGSRLASGRALAEGMPFQRYAGNRLITAIENAVFGLSFAEYHSGYMAYSPRALRTIPFHALSDRFHFDGEVLLAAGKLGLRVATVPVSTRFDGDSSSLAPLPYLREIAGVLWRYARRDYPFQQR